MRAVAIHGKEHLELDERPVPEPGPDQVRLRVRYVGICGSDIHYYFTGANGEYTVREPLVPGHELSAVVDVDRSGTLAPGTPVTVHPARYGPAVAGLEGKPQLWPGGDYLGSAGVFPHRQGAACDYLVVDAAMLRPLPESLPLERAALAEPLGVALHSIAVAGEIAGKRTLVLGCGPIGLLVVAALAQLGAGPIAASDIRPEPLDRAQSLGASLTYLVGHDEIENASYDVVFECSGSGAGLSKGIQAAGRAGTVVQVGILPSAEIGVDLAPMLTKELTVKGAFRFADEIDDAITMLAASDAFDAVITHTFPLAGAAEAFAIARDTSRSAKVLLAI
jgi:Threonine dehydrogenase and related Zn-dependent dehydrogenases